MTAAIRFDWVVTEKMNLRPRGTGEAVAEGNRESGDGRRIGEFYKNIIYVGQ